MLAMISFKGRLSKRSIALEIELHDHDHGDGLHHHDYGADRRIDHRAGDRHLGP
jgi:hypothetical protein